MCAYGQEIWLLILIFGSGIFIYCVGAIDESPPEIVGSGQVGKAVHLFCASTTLSM